MAFELKLADLSRTPKGWGLRERETCKKLPVQQKCTSESVAPYTLLVIYFHLCSVHPCRKFHLNSTLQEPEYAGVQDRKGHVRTF